MNFMNSILIFSYGVRKIDLLNYLSKVVLIKLLYSF